MRDSYIFSIIKAFWQHGHICKGRVEVQIAIGKGKRWSPEQWLKEERKGKPPSAKDGAHHMTDRSKE